MARRFRLYIYSPRGASRATLSRLRRKEGEEILFTI